MKVLILGYYHRKNLGDDVFEHVLSIYFQKRWKEAEYQFISIDDLKSIPPDTTAVLFGGGDLINDYFYRKIIPFLMNKTCPWYAISIGIPYPKLIEQGYLDRFDYIIHRSQADHFELNHLYDTRSRWYPDISFLMQSWSAPLVIRKVQRKTKKIGVCLSRTVYNAADPGAYQRIVNNISRFLSDLAMEYRDGFSCSRKPVYEIYLLPFCTDGPSGDLGATRGCPVVQQGNPMQSADALSNVLPAGNNHNIPVEPEDLKARQRSSNPPQANDHDDRLINQDVYDKIKDYGCRNNVYLVDRELTMQEILPLFHSFYATICTRFHAHMFSLMAKVPVLSIYTTRKVENLLTEMGGVEYACPMETHQKGYPINIDPDLLKRNFERMVTEYDVYQKRLDNLHGLYSQKIVEFEQTLDNLLFYLPRYVQPDEINEKALKIGKSIAEKLTFLRNGIPSYHDVFDHQNSLSMNLVSDNNNNRRDHSYNILHKTGTIKKLFFYNEKIVEIISYELTGQKRSIYYYGLNEQVFTSLYNLKESCQWILKDKYQTLNNENYQFLNNVAFPLNKRKININDTNLFHGYHRSGWNYVLSKLKELHNPNGVIFDSYLDKTFGWEYDFLTVAQVIPYRKPWIGVFHHTPDTDYTENNLVNVFSKKNFIDSLSHCRGLIVLSQSNQRWVQDQLAHLLINIPVIALTHPTELVPEHLKFDYQLFKRQETRQIVQIGAWLRDSYAIYNLKVPTNFAKVALKGRDMNNYFISEENLQTILCFSRGIASNKARESCYLAGNKDVNKYIVGLTELIETNHHSVAILENISNHQYDHILQSSLVFIKLVDASAVNTILECIVRNTPILVNRLPATEEYLGRNYPLFYDTLDEATQLLYDRRNIKKAYKYLCRMSKEKFTVEFFINSLMRSDLYSSL